MQKKLWSVCDKIMSFIPPQKKNHILSLKRKAKHRNKLKETTKYGFQKLQTKGVIKAYEH
jgi:hypothetical protein